jgi:hypothetical protein
MLRIILLIGALALAVAGTTTVAFRTTGAGTSARPAAALLADLARRAQVARLYDQDAADCHQRGAAGLRQQSGWQWI